MTEDQPRTSQVKVAFAIVAVPVLTFAGCTMLANEGRGYSGKGPWEVTVLSLFVLAGILTIVCYRLAFKSGPSFAIHDDRVEHFGWKTPIYFRDIDEVVFEPGDFWAKRGDTVYFRLLNGSVQYIPYSLMTHGPAEFAALLTAALERFRANAVS
ncbi:MAG: hypothetical protein KKG14_14030 [Alphaproteobacteria bacterium]|nr:hypothetical protein [Alphaproteobacteria bacterium]MBU2271036.1 hypothetical protein [Alphaproteobacteria bacterium]MBU2419816.1 hypothetical protein [Alphaproteobacteria bacterium]